MTQISIVVPVFNQVHLTRRCFDSLLAGTRIARELIVINNHSTDETAVALNQYKNKFTEQGWNFVIINNQENVGFGRACNQGIRLSQGEYVAVLNNDTWLMPGWDAVLLRKAQELGVDMIGPHIDESPFDLVRVREKASRFVRKNHGKSSSDWISILMFFRRESLEKLGVETGPFDERFFVTYEDADLRTRMDQAGMRYRQVADCYIWHFSKGTREHSGLPSDYEQEGLRLFVEKWGFDPRLSESTKRARFRRRFKKFKTAFGLF